MKISFNSISKTYGAVVANDSVNINIESGTIHAIIGENGAGKSTLVKMLSGQVVPDKGSISINGEVVKGFSVQNAINLGIGLLGQDPMDFQNLTVMDCFSVGHRLNGKIRNKRLLKEEFDRLNVIYGFGIQPKKKIHQLSIGERQQLELMRLLSNGAQVIILDEPNSGFSLEQKSKVFRALTQLTEEGCTVVLVSHKLEDVMEHASSVSIMRKGRVIDTLDLPQEPKQLVKLMFGETTEEYVSHTNTALNVGNLHLFFDQMGRKKELNLTNGIMVGIAGLQGSGIDKFLKKMFYEKSFSLISDGKTISKSGFGYVPADRLERGLFPELTILEHHALSFSSDHNVIDWSNILDMCRGLIEEYGIIGNPETKANELSGGNQQRLMLSMLKNNIDVAMLEHPTRGLDLQSADYIWDKLVTHKTDRVLTMYSSYDVDEICSYSDYVVCFHGEEIVSASFMKDITKTDIINNISGNLRENND